MAQLEGYLRCNTPILILSDKKVRELCKKHDMWDLYENWRRNAPIAEFLENTVPKKIAKGQEVLDMDEYNSILAEFKNDNEYPTDPFVYKGAVP